MKGKLPLVPLVDHRNEILPSLMHEGCSLWMRKLRNTKFRDCQRCSAQWRAWAEAASHSSSSSSRVYMMGMAQLCPSSWGFSSPRSACLAWSQESRGPAVPPVVWTTSQWTAAVSPASASRVSETPNAATSDLFRSCDLGRAWRLSVLSV